MNGFVKLFESIIQLTYMIVYELAVARNSCPVWKSMVNGATETTRFRQRKVAKLMRDDLSTP